MGKRAIVWFKTDLRLQDNEVLLRALAWADEIIPVYCFDDEHYTTTEFGFQKTGSFRAQFLLESVAALEAALRQLGSGLLVLRGRPEAELAAVAREYKAQKIYAKKEVGYEEIRKEELVEKELWKQQCSLEKFSTSTLYHPEDMPFTIKDIPDVFSRFRKSVEKETGVRTVFPASKTIRSPQLPQAVFPTLHSLGLQPVAEDSRTAMPFRGGEKAALQRLQYYLDESQAIATYQESRNGMIGPDYSSKLSAYLAAGCLSPRTVYHALKKYEARYAASKSTYWLVFELLWRDFFRFMMKKYRRSYFLQWGIKEPGQRLPVDNRELLEQWVDARTGNDFIDAHMTELKLSGYMSNRGRQNVASYFCHELKLDWRYGAAYFEQQLIDYDVSSNWGNWAYLAGVGNDPHGMRRFNIEKQAADYDPDGLFRKLWLQPKKNNSLN